MSKLFSLALCGLLATAVTGCGLVYKPVVQQGNLLDKKKVEQLKPGMTKRQVIALLGTPSVTTPFDRSRWDYVQANVPRSGKMTLRKLSLYFDNNTLARTEGKFFDTPAEQLLKDAKRYKSAYPANETRGDKSYDDGKSDGDKG
jgi:outer membrane protein assembly factor BamE